MLKYFPTDPNRLFEIKPFKFNILGDLTKKFFNYDLNTPEKTIMIGDQILSDVLFGRLNKMATIWIKKPDLLYNQKDADFILLEENA